MIITVYFYYEDIYKIFIVIFHSPIARSDTDREDDQRRLVEVENGEGETRDDKKGANRSFRDDMRIRHNGVPNYLVRDSAIFWNFAEIFDEYDRSGETDAVADVLYLQHK